jgi:monoamine oxidase/SAM-dependent methyltransferase
MKRIAIIGGGPGGLFAAHQLQTTCAELADLTIIEASGRLGGKISTARFDSAPVTFEAGVAELYGYNHIGPDPIHALVRSLKLETAPMKGPTVVFGDKIMRNDREIAKHLGAEALAEIDRFIELCEDQMEPVEYYDGYQGTDNAHPWMNLSLRELLDREFTNEDARRYIEVMVRSDTATEPHLTTALNGLKNVLMDDRDFLRYYTITGGIEQLVDRLKAKLTAKVQLNTAATRIAKTADGLWDVTLSAGGRTRTDRYDLVICALPNYWLERIEWGDKPLRMAMQSHLARYDHPAHYLRVSILFKSRFWEDVIPGEYWITDAFGGACVYNESARHPSKGKKGALSWLIAGNDALVLSNLSDEALRDLCLASLPAEMAGGRRQALEVKVHRWASAVNAIPGGRPMAEMRERHEPALPDYPGLYTCGDYMFDSTVNGTYDSADFATDLILTRLRGDHYGTQGKKVADDVRGDLAASASVDQVTLSEDYHDEYALGMTYEESFREYFDETYTCDLIETIWDVKAPYRLLDCGSASGLTLECFQNKGVEAWGIENNEHIHGQTAKEWLDRNLLGDIRALPFPDKFFDVIYDTSLCYVPEAFQEQAISELFRVVKIGVFFGGITSDMTKEVIEYHEIFDGVQVLETQWAWAERFMRQGFKLAVVDQKILRKAWKIEVDSNEDDYPWYPNKETMRYCFFSKPDAAEHVAALKAGAFKAWPRGRPALKVSKGSMAAGA